MLYGLIYFICFTISLLFIIRIFQFRNSLISYLLLIMTIFDSFWLLMEALSFVVQSDHIILILQILKYISVIFITPLFFITVLKHTQKIKQNLMTYLLFIFIIPIISIVSLFTNSFPYKFWNNVYVRFIDGIPAFIHENTLGFIVHSIYSYLLIILSCILLMYKAIKSPKLYRKQSSFIFIGCTSSFIINLLFTLNYMSFIMMDFTSVLILGTLFIIFWGIYRLPQNEVVPAARDLVIESIQDIVIITDNDNQIIDANPSTYLFLNTYTKHTLNRDFFINPANGMKLDWFLENLPITIYEDPLSKNLSGSLLIYNDKTNVFYFNLYESLIFDSDNSTIGKVYILHDVTKLNENLNHLQKLNNELIISDKIINDTLEGVLITDKKGIITRVNHSFEKMSGFTKEELIGQNPRMMKSDKHDIAFYNDMWQCILNNGFWEGEIWDRRKNGELYPKWLSISTIYDINGEFANYMSISSDISKIKRAENELQTLAYYDSLTGIPNRTLFYERLERALIHAKRDNKSIALLFMDLDRFKIVNDTLGHAAGDMILVEVANRLKGIIRESDTVSRLGGDEFTIILESIKDSDDAKRVAECAIQEIMKPFHVLGKEVSMGVSIGISLAPNDENTVEGIFRKADAAMYNAKETGQGTYSFSSEDIETKNLEILETEIRIRNAIENKEFRLFLQPIMSLIDGKYQPVSAEALIRWIPCEGQMISPDKFIPIAENSGLIIQIGNWVVEEIFKINTKLLENGIHTRLSINVSGKQWDSDNFVNHLKHILHNNSTNNINLVLEITESSLINRIDSAVEKMKEIKEYGIEIALDDFGTGFSSLKYLNKLPVDYLKIDKSFISNIEGAENTNLTSSIISIAKTLNLKSIAEGVETIEQIESLTAKQCDEFQGYYFSKPVDLDIFIDFMKKYK